MSISIASRSTSIVSRSTSIVSISVSTCIVSIIIITGTFYHKAPCAEVGVETEAEEGGQASAVSAEVFLSVFT